MKAKLILAALLAATLGLGVLVGCNDSDSGNDKDSTGDNTTQNDPPKDDDHKDPPKDDDSDTKLTDAALTGSTVADFAQGDPGNKVLFASDGWTNGSVFNTVWTSGNLSYSDGAMHLGIKEESKSAWVDGAEKAYDYTSGEARTAYYYGYGDYEVRMKPTDSVGTASTFFVCTGNYDEWPDGTQNPWDEIDIEFLGASPTKVQFNYFANGVGGHEHMYDLGFDASKEFHNYGFRWAEDHITWFVDGTPVYRVNKADVKTGEAFPKTAGRILMNYWCGTEDAEGWMGKFNGPDGKTADYQWVKTSAQKVNPPMGDPYPDTPTPPPATDETDWSEVAAQKLGFASSAPFTVALSQDELSADITYTAAVGASYKNVEMPAPAAAANTNLAHFKIKNNGTESVFLRISLVNNEKDAENVASGYAKSSDVNVSATMDGMVAETNTTNGGSYFTIPAGAEVECVIKFNGTVDRIQLMPDTSKYGDSATHAGSLTVSELKFAGEGTGDEPTPPPATDETDWNELDAQELGFVSTEQYTVAPAADKKSAQITYTDLAGGHYENVEMDITAMAAGKTAMHLTVKNNGTATVGLRINLVNSDLVAAGGNNSAVNKSATMDGTAVRTDLEYGGSYFDIPAGQTAECVIVFEGVANKLQLMLDTAIYQDTKTYSGDVTVSALKFAAGESTGDEPYTPADGTALTFTTEPNSGYTVKAGTDNKSWTLDYVGKGDTYKPVTAECANLAAGKNTFTITIKNNKTTAVTVRVDVQGTTWVSTSDSNADQGTDCTNRSATCTGGTGLSTDLTWGGTKVTLAANEEVTLTITYDETAGQGAVKNILVYVDSMGGDTNDHDASVTVSGFTFEKKD